MMATKRRTLPWVVAALVSCQQPPQPTPVRQSEPLERPVRDVTAEVDGLLAVPQSAVVRRGGLPGVFVLLEGLARFQVVRTGHRQGGKVEVLSGLSGGDVVVTGDLEMVRDGTPVTVKR